MAKVGPDEVMEMRYLHENLFYSTRSLSEKYGLSTNRIRFYLKNDDVLPAKTSDVGHYPLPEVIPLTPPVPMIEGKRYVISPSDAREKDWKPVMILEQKRSDRFLFRSLTGWCEEFTLVQICDSKVDFA